MTELPARAARRLAAAILLALAGLAPAAAVEPLDVRALPTAVETWRWPGPAQSVLATPDRLFIAGNGRVTAIDPRDGEVRWSTVIGAETERCGEALRIDDRLFVPVAGAVAVLDGDDGKLLTRVEIGEAVHPLRGPPVVVAGVGDGKAILVRLDERRGVELARLDVPGGTDLDRFGNRFTLQVVRTAADRQAGEPTTALLGFDDMLRVTWRRELPGLRRVDRNGDRLLVSEGPGSSMQALDPESGELGPAEPFVSARVLDTSSLRCTDSSGGQDLVLDKVVARGEATTVRMRRPDKEGWTADLPGRISFCGRSGRRLLLHLDLGSTRGLLAVLDERTGKLEAMLRLPAGVTYIYAAGERAILARRGVLIGVDPLAAGPSEAESRTLADSVAEVLAQAAESPRGLVLAELEALGAEAVPLAVSALPRLSVEAAVVVADLAAKAGYAPAAAPLAAALERNRAEEPSAQIATGPSMQAGERVRLNIARHVERSLATALAAIAGPPQVSVLARYAKPGWDEACPAAIAALGRIGTPRAVAALDTIFAARDLPATDWYHPPTPPAAGALLPQAAQLRWRSLPESDRFAANELSRSARSVEAVGGNHRLLVFPGSALDSEGDYWVAELAPGLAPEGAAPVSPPVYYLGPVDAASGGACQRVTASVRDGALLVDCEGERFDGFLTAEEEQFAADEELTRHLWATVEEPPPPGSTRPLRLPLGSWRRDADGDGFTDLLELRLHLDATRADTDGDGIGDARDRSPNGRSPQPGRDDEMTVAALQSLWACSEGRRNALFVAGAPPLEWRGRGGPSINLEERELADLSPGDARLLRVRVDGDLPARFEQQPLSSGERRIVVRCPSVDRQNESTSLSELLTVGIVMRRLEGRWLVSRYEGWPRICHGF